MAWTLAPDSVAVLAQGLVEDGFYFRFLAFYRLITLVSTVLCRI